MVAAPEDRAEAVGRLIAGVGGKLIAYYLTSGDYDILLIFDGPSYEDVVPALIIAAAGGAVADLKTVTALTSSEMKSAFAKAGAIAANYRAPGATAASCHEPLAGTPPSDSHSEGATNEAEDEAKTAAKILDARKKSMEDIEAGRPAPYYLARSPLPTNDTDPAKA